MVNGEWWMVNGEWWMGSRYSGLIYGLAPPEIYCQLPICKTITGVPIINSSQFIVHSSQFIVHCAWLIVVSLMSYWFFMLPETVGFWSVVFRELRIKWLDYYFHKKCSFFMKKEELFKRKILFSRKLDVSLNEKVNFHEKRTFYWKKGPFLMRTDLFV